MLSFVNFSLDVCKPFVFTFMIIGICYLIIIFFIIGCMNVREIYPLMPPYKRLYFWKNQNYLLKKLKFKKLKLFQELNFKNF